MASALIEIEGYSDAMQVQRWMEKLNAFV